jgi:hypothetical protein
MAVDVANQLRRFLSESAPKGLVSAYLFGSYSEARSHRESDVDVAVLSTAAAERARAVEERRLIGAVGRPGLGASTSIPTTSLLNRRAIVTAASSALFRP